MPLWKSIVDKYRINPKALKGPASDSSAARPSKPGRIEYDNIKTRSGDIERLPKRGYSSYSDIDNFLEAMTEAENNHKRR